jgi:hypothetical protein
MFDTEKSSMCPKAGLIVFLIVFLGLGTVVKELSGQDGVCRRFLLPRATTEAIRMSRKTGQVFRLLREKRHMSTQDSLIHRRLSGSQRALSLPVLRDLAPPSRGDL